MARRQVSTGQYPIGTNAPAGEPLSDEQLEAIAGSSFFSSIEHTLSSAFQRMQNQLGSTVQTIEEGVDFVLKSINTLLPK